MDVKSKDMRSKSDVTCLAVIPDVASWTVTLVTVDLVFTAPSVLTRTAGTLVNVCGDSFIEGHQCTSNERAEDGGGVGRKRAGGEGIVRRIMN